MSTNGTPRCALIIGHPGHELRVLGWLSEFKPLVAVLTDGSGHHGASRLELTLRLLESAGARVSSSYGVISDREMYRTILQQDLKWFVTFAERLAGLLVDHAIDCVAGDAIEGYNPTHDVCRLLIDKAVNLAEHRSRGSIKNYSVSLVAADRTPRIPAEAWRIALTPPQRARKLEQCRRYADAAGGELPTELDKLLQTDGDGAEELLYPVDTAAALARFEHEQPFYEIHGERRVAAGQYTDVIRFRQHIAPIAAALAVPS